MAYGDFEVDLAQRAAEPRCPIRDFPDHPVIAAINLVAAAVMEVVGPFCWAALILMFFVAEFSAD